MAEWLGDTPIFQATMTTAERAEFELFKTSVKAIDTKETDMAKKNDAQTTIDMNATINESKEDSTMTENAAANVNANEKENVMSIEGIPMKARKNGTAYYDRNTDVERHIAIRKATKFGRIKGIEVVSCIPGLTPANISKDAAEIELLGKACAKFGWKNGVCTQAKAKNYHGTPNPEYKGHGWFVKFAGAKDETSGTVAYPMEAFIWDTESGLPEFDEEKKAQDDARKAKSRFNAAQRALKEANAAAGIKTTRRKTSRKPKTETIAAAPVPMAAPAQLIHIKLANGIEFDARDAKEAAELKALFE